MPDPYQILGAIRDATPDAIRKAYRALAKKSHPDLHPGDKAAETRFKDIASSYGIVGDETKRAQFDAGKIDGSGNEKQQQSERRSYRRHADAGQQFKYDRPWNGNGQAEDDIFAELFGQRGRANQKGDDVHYSLAVDFVDAIRGTKKRVVMDDGRTLDITIQGGLKEGQTLRLRGQGYPGNGNAGAGDVLVQVHVEPHAVFHRDGDDIRSIVPVSLAEALAGAKLPIGTVFGKINLTVPKGSNTGTVLRLRGKGVATKTGAGDHFVELKVMLPEGMGDDIVQTIVAWEAKHPFDPRKSLGEIS
jgi:DnaJ-class molecular chaperone